MIDINMMRGLPVEPAEAIQLAARASSRRELEQATAEAILCLLEELPLNLLPHNAVELQIRVGEALEKYQQVRDLKR